MKAVFCRSRPDLFEVNITLASMMYVFCALSEFNTPLPATAAVDIQFVPGAPMKPDPGC